ncbi:MAG: D-alanyl-D-alanine carboxypeptidase family protein [Gammaproteobacteria bacterium]|nr:D-alanyl-D-alanine carboxypeptidase family protein [Gammaproteobacteria bacterium]
MTRLFATLFRVQPAMFTALCASLLALAAFSAQAVAALIPVPAPPSVDAKAHILVDFHSGHILSETNARERVEPASLTKLMTTYIVFSELQRGNVALTDQVLVSEKAWRTPGSRSFVEVNTRVSVEDLLKGVIVQSGNDATVALAEHIAGSEGAFAELMNNYARALNMNDSHFINSTGLPAPDHYTSAVDMAQLLQAIIRQFPEYYTYYSLREHTYNGITQPNRNRLLWRDPSVDGGKTGHTESAGYCLVTSALRDDMRLVSVVLGTRSEEARLQESAKLLNYGFRFFETRLVHAAAEPVTATRIWQGAAEQLQLGIEQDLYVTIPRNSANQLETVLEIVPSILAPVSQGDQLGRLEVRLNGEELTTRPLVAISDMGQGGFARRLADRVLMFFH